jgi:hypothetical protein
VVRIDRKMEWMVKTDRELRPVEVGPEAVEA